MDFSHSERSLELQRKATDFMQEFVYPSEEIFETQAAANRAEGTPFQTPAVLRELKSEAKARDLWNLFLPDERYGVGLSVTEYAPIAEITGRSPMIAPEAMNCAAPDTGNMELMAMFGTDEQRERWLEPLLAGDIRSCFSMTEPGVASSDATNMETTIVKDGDAYVVSGRKWWSTGAMRPECRIAIVMGLSVPDGPRHERHSMIVVPLATPGVTLERSTTVFGYDDGPHGGHAVISFDDVRVPERYLLGQVGGGFMMSQARLGPGRIHHCMRQIGIAERALELMCDRARRRVAFGKPLAEQGVVQEWIAESRLLIDQARLLTLNAAWRIDTVGARNARGEIATIKIAAPRVASYVIDRAIQVHGGAGVSSDTPLAALWAHARTIHLADGPDEVHMRSVARHELKQSQPVEALPSSR